ncbi:hypothetical protein DCAR_0417336 [Daucus carota subsp. sativus]|uniref:F-box domain-containing protein n=1 Tax=Daucus carota subsp. sativus TaxID=79200 RepID=A0A162ABY4_DAUCS|nr:PREDICTED: F-box/kelch-repeat protein At2g44130-like [Daucus carota subsp. sativus]WOG97995.1 hypothetical protein DCAR_0417336 [Daucus carota subsp. sativus]
MSKQFTELIPGLPEEIALECLTRLHFSAHRVGSHVAERWRQLLQSRDFYYHRKQSGQTRKLACLVQSLPVPKEPTGSKPAAQARYGVSVFDPGSRTWYRVDPIPKYPDGMPLFCQVASTEGKLVCMGGWDPASYEPVRDVFVYEFTTQRWTRCQDMPSNRSFFAVGAMEGKVYVAGGHDDSKNALNSAWVYDLSSDEWTELTRMSEERDECQGIIIGNEFWVVSGYETDAQGQFKSTAEAFSIDSGEWRRVEDSWTVSQCPRSCVGVGKNGELINWAETDSGVRVGACGVNLGNRSLVTGSEYQGAAQGFFLTERREGQNCKSVKVEVSDDFCTFVQSGCCVEI